MAYRFTALTITVLLAAIAGSQLAGREEAPIARPPAVQASAAAAQPASSAPLLQQAIARLNQQESVSAQVRHRTELFGQLLVGSGNYYQLKSDKGPLVRFSLSVRSNDQTLSLLHVCDGRFLWSRDSLDSEVQLSRIDLRRLQELAGSVAPVPTAASSLLPGGGLPQLLTALQMDFDFGEPREMDYQDVPMWALTGRWNRARLTSRLPDKTDLFDAAGHLRLEQLPEQLPDRILLLLGRDDLFPYHIDFRRTRPEAVADDESSYWRSPTRSLVTMDLFEVQLGAALDPLLFVYRPGDAEVHDRTDEYISKLQLPADSPPAAK